MVEVPRRFLSAGTDHENRRDQEVRRLEVLSALPRDAVREFLQSIELRTLRKAANILGVLHVVPALLKLGRCGHAALNRILSASGPDATAFFALSALRRGCGDGMPLNAEAAE